MRLTELDPEWVYDFNAGSMKWANDVHSTIHHDVAEDDRRVGLSELTVTNAQGILFLCPTCFKKNGGPVGTESVLCWFRNRGVPDDAVPGPGRWYASGTGFDDLSLSPSVNVDHEHWHGFVTNGEIK